MIDTTTLLEVTTLGRFEIRRNHIPLTGGNWSRRKVNDLFKLLLSAEQHRLHREQIQDTLWPDSTSEQAANSFSKTLYLLRRALEPDLVAGKGSASIYVLERKMLAAGLNPAHLWGTPEDWGPGGPILDEWMSAVAEDLAVTIVAANAIVDLEGAIIDGAMPDSVRAGIVERTRAAMATLDLQGLTPVTLRAGTIGPNARAIGGATLPFLANFARDRDVLFKETPQLRELGC